MSLDRSGSLLTHGSLVAVSYQQLQLTPGPSSASGDGAPYLCLAAARGLLSPTHASLAVVEVAIKEMCDV